MGKGNLRDVISYNPKKIKERAEKEKLVGHISLQGDDVIIDFTQGERTMNVMDMPATDEKSDHTHMIMIDRKLLEEILTKYQMHIWGLPVSNVEVLFNNKPLDDEEVKKRISDAVIGVLKEVAKEEQNNGKENV